MNSEMVRKKEKDQESGSTTLGIPSQPRFLPKMGERLKVVDIDIFTNTVTVRELTPWEEICFEPA